MKIDKLKEIFEDEGLKYALATNLAKYGRPQSKKSDKPSKLTKGLEKKREKHVKDLKKSMDEKVDLVHVMDKDTIIYWLRQLIIKLNLPISFTNRCYISVFSITMPNKFSTFSIV